MAYSNGQSYFGDAALSEPEAEEGYRGIGIAGRLEKKGGGSVSGGGRKNWKWRMASFEHVTGELRYYDSDHIDEAALKGHGVALGVDDIPDRENTRANRFDVLIDHVERGGESLLECCVATEIEKANWIVAIKKRVNRAKVHPVCPPLHLFSVCSQRVFPTAVFRSPTETRLRTRRWRTSVSSFHTRRPVLRTISRTEHGGSRRGSCEARGARRAACAGTAVGLHACRLPSLHRSLHPGFTRARRKELNLY
jgi:hypothetical protein